MEELKPCPSCGKKCLAIDRDTGAVACMLCGMRAPNKDVWNRRAAPENKGPSQAIKDANELIRALICGMEPNPCEWCTGKNCETCCLCTQDDEDECKFFILVEAAESEGSEIP